LPSSYGNRDEEMRILDRVNEEVEEMARTDPAMKARLELFGKMWDTIRPLLREADPTLGYIFGLSIHKITKILFERYPAYTNESKIAAMAWSEAMSDLIIQTLIMEYEQK
jgi:hypothetical protein